MSGFLIEYNRRSSDWRLTEYEGETGPRRAMIERLRLERERADADWEIAALASDSLDTLRKTHSRYFRGRRLSSIDA
jgi:hypothetical protein